MYFMRMRLIYTHGALQIQREMELMKEEIRLNQHLDNCHDDAFQGKNEMTKNLAEYQRDIQFDRLPDIIKPENNLIGSDDIIIRDEKLCSDDAERCGSRDEDLKANKEKLSKFSLEKCRIIVAAEVLSAPSIVALNKCRELGLFEYGNLVYTDEAAINVFVVEIEGPNQGDLLLCSPTVTYIKAICVGVYIVNSLWLIKMSEQSRRLRPREYEISGSIYDSISGGPFRARKAPRNAMGQLKLFEDLIFIFDFPLAKGLTFWCFDSASVLISEAELRWIIYFCGGSVLGFKETKSFLLGGNISFLRNRSFKTSVVRLISANSPQIDSEIEFSFVVLRSVVWLIHSVCIQKI